MGLVLEESINPTHYYALLGFIWTVKIYYHSGLAFNMIILSANFICLSKKKKRTPQGRMVMTSLAQRPSFEKTWQGASNYSSGSEFQQL